jgi:hypothetical protein
MLNSHKIVVGYYLLMLFSVIALRLFAAVFERFLRIDIGSKYLEPLACPYIAAVSFISQGTCNSVRCPFYVSEIAFL